MVSVAIALQHHDHTLKHHSRLALLSLPSNQEAFLTVSVDSINATPCEISQPCIHTRLWLGACSTMLHEMLCSHYTQRQEHIVQFTAHFVKHVVRVNAESLMGPSSGGGGNLTNVIELLICAGSASGGHQLGHQLDPLRPCCWAGGEYSHHSLCSQKLYRVST